MANRLTNLFLQRRHYTPEYLATIENGKHQNLENVDELASILKGIHDRKDQIVIMPDFDTDGISAGTVGFAGLSELGFNVSLYRPIAKNGYGIRISDIKRVQQEFPNVKYIISCDVGITCYDAFFYAQSCGIKVLITDHHEEEIQAKKDEQVPSWNTNVEIDNTNFNVHVTGQAKLYCQTIVNPCQLSETYKLRDICGAFVFYQVLQYYAQKYESKFMQEQIDRLCVFAGIGTIGDMEPLVNENRKLLENTVSMLKLIYNNDDISVADSISGCGVYKRAFRGLFAFLHSLKQNGQLRTQDDLNAKYIGWTIAPVYNSIKRMGLSMDLIFGVFFAPKYEDQLTNSQMAIDANNQRKEEVADYFQKIAQENENGLQPFAPFIYYTDAPGGIIGLLAQQVKQISGLPTFVINRNNLSGSGRSCEYFPVITALSETEFTVKGHEEAFGIEFSDHDQVGRFYDYLVQNILPLAKQYSETHTVNYDLCLTSGNMNVKSDGKLNVDECSEFHRDMLSMSPWGSGFEEPEIKVIFDPAKVEIMTMGKAKEHLKIKLPNNVELIAWKKADMADEIKHSKLAYFMGDFQFNNFMGKVSLQMIGDFSTEAGDEIAKN